MGNNWIGGADAAHELYDDYAVGTHLIDKAVKWIGKQSKPFFLYLATTHIHHPFTPAKRFQDTSECGPYGDFIHELDWMVGEVMKALEKKGVADNTVVIFTSDNGGMFNVGGQDAWDKGHTLNGALLGFKFGAWEGGHRVPFIVRWPGKVEAGSTSSQLISNVDLMATLATVSGAKVPEGQGVDSINVLPTFTGSPDKPIRETLVLQASKKTHLSVRKGKWMYIPAQGSGGFTASKRGAHAFGGPAAISYAGRKNSDIENGKYKADAPQAQLYDLEKDLAQTTNLITKHPEIAKEMQALLQSYRDQASNESLPVGSRKPKPKKK